MTAKQHLGPLSMLSAVLACGGAETSGLEAPRVLVDETGRGSCVPGADGLGGSAAAAYGLEDHHRVLATYRYRLLSDPSAPPRLEQLDIEWQRESLAREGAWVSLARLRIWDAARIDSGRTYDLGPQLANAGAADLDILTRTAEARPSVRSGRAFVMPGTSNESLVRGCLEAELDRGLHEDEATSLRGAFEVAETEVLTLD